MNIEIEEREVDTLPNDMELGKYVRHKMNEAKKAHYQNTTTISGNYPSWTTNTTLGAPTDIEWDLNSNKI